MKKDILGVGVSDLTRVEALALVKERIESGEKGYIVTPNAEMLVQAQGDSEFRSILNQAFLALPDSFFLFQAAKLFGRNLTERITGVDFTYDLAALCEEHGYSVFLFGGREGVAKEASRRLQERFPKLIISGSLDGLVIGKDNNQIENMVKENDFDLILVALGAGKQEKWIKENLPNIKAKVAIGVGGALDYISEEKKRAPVWMQKVGLEWFYRLLKEPWRAKRQLALPVFGILVLKEWVTSFSKR